MEMLLRLRRNREGKERGQRIPKLGEEGGANY